MKNGFFYENRITNVTMLARKSGRDICEWLNVRPELRDSVRRMFGYKRANSMFVDFLKECFAKDDLKGTIAWGMLDMHVPGARIGEELQFNLFRDTVNAFY